MLHQWPRQPQFYQPALVAEEQDGQPADPQSCHGREVQELQQPPAHGPRGHCTGEQQPSAGEVCLGSLEGVGYRRCLSAGSDLISCQLSRREGQLCRAAQHGERLRELGLVSLERRRLRRDPISPYKCPQGCQDGARLFQQQDKEP